ncbi:MAG TPA: DUF1345 domain-containing protein [Burkholderiales bacterium]|nr:DUF1345 domain-containing protein [Burkholderiales bacterium]
MKEDERRSREASSRLNAHRRLLIGLVIAAAVWFLLPASLPPAARLAIAWDSAVLEFLLITWWVAADCPPEEMREAVLANDQGRVGILVLVLLAVCASLAEIFFLVQSAKDAGPPPAHVALAVFTIVCSWFVTHVMFALHYAHRFYRDDPKTPEADATGGLDFPGDEQPDYRDFMYFSFVIGMTSQVSDVQVTSRPMRRLVFWHSILSFTFYTVILALSINIVAGMM